MYKDIWPPTLGEKLSAATELENYHDKYAVKVSKDNEMVGNAPRDISKYCSSALLCGETIKCEITEKRQNKSGSGLEVPCKYIVKRPFQMVLNIEKIIKDHLSRTTK